MAGLLASKKVVVTGGAGALGGAVVRAFVDGGAEVHVPLFDDRAGDLSTLGNVHTYPSVHLDDADAVAQFYAARGPIWASVHLAGGFAMASIEATSVAELRKQLDMNFVSCFLSCKHAVMAMKAGGGGGRIVNVAARAVVQPSANMSAYIASKAAVAALTQALAVEVLSDGILVNAVLPSIIDTPANRKAMPNAPFDTWPKPAELAATILHLASPANALTSGALVPVYGRA